MNSRRKKFQAFHWGWVQMGLVLAAPSVLRGQATSIIQGHVSD